MQQQRILPRAPIARQNAAAQATLASYAYYDVSSDRIRVNAAQVPPPGSPVSSTYTPNLTVYSTSSIPNFNLAAAFSVVLALATFALSFTFLKFTQRRSAR